MMPAYILNFAALIEEETKNKAYKIKNISQELGYCMIVSVTIHFHFMENDGMKVNSE